MVGIDRSNQMQPLLSLAYRTLTRFGSKRCSVSNTDSLLLSCCQQSSAVGSRQTAPSQTRRDCGVGNNVADTGNHRRHVGPPRGPTWPLHIGPKRRDDRFFNNCDARLYQQENSMGEPQPQVYLASRSYCSASSNRALDSDVPLQDKTKGPYVP